MKETILTGRNARIWNIAVRLLFAAYLLWMVWLLYFQRMDDVLRTRAELLQLRPLRTIRPYFYRLCYAEPTSHGFREAFIQLFGNIGMFLPFGVCLPEIFPKLRHFGRFFLTFFMIDLAIEGIQLLTRLGFFETDDLILNCSGAVIGWLLWFFIRRAVAAYSKKHPRGDNIP